MSALLWFRRDLRVHDNPALCAALAQGATEALFISTPQQWHKHNMAPIQADFIGRHLTLLARQLAPLGITLIHKKASDYAEQVKVIQQWCSAKGYRTVLANRELEFNETRRDQSFNKQHLNLKLFQCDTILPVGSVLNKQGEMFKVFTPFKKAWLQQLNRVGITCVAKPSELAEFSPAQHTSTPFSVDFDYPLRDSCHWPLSETAMSNVIPHFLGQKVTQYGQKRDFPYLDATSGLSPYLAIGAISARWLSLQLLQKYPALIDDCSHPSFSWFNELIWRDFYKHLLYHYPDLAKGQSFQAKYQNMQWQGNPQHFKAWCEGHTGYPIIDAAMRQLTQTGWMHNRLRMVVASFLTKHLLIDWRLGEQFFMSQLIDGDLSANNGGWQWAASTGCDAQPFFRIFNPLTQSKKFDPNGDFIRSYLPELEQVPTSQIHFPHDYLAKSQHLSWYWPAIVEHKCARLKALDFYKRYQR